MQETYKQIFTYLDLFSKHWRLIMIITVIFTLAAGGLSLLMAKHYRSTTMILVEHQKIQESYVKSTDKTPIESRLRTIKQQILSRTKLEKIINRYKLFSAPPHGLFSELLTQVKPGSSTLLTSEEKVELIKKNITIKVIGKSGGRGGDA